MAGVDMPRAAQRLGLRGRRQHAAGMGPRHGLTGSAAAAMLAAESRTSVRREARQNREPLGRFFISYRRIENCHAGRMGDHISTVFPDDRLFLDVESLRAGEDFERQLTAELESCDAMIVVIGPAWAGATGPDRQSRLASPADFVRREVETALRRDVLVIPVLVGEARLPAARDLPPSMRDLVRRQAIELRDDPHYRQDIKKLVEALKGIPSKSAPGAPPTDTMYPVKEHAAQLTPVLASSYAFLWLETKLTLRSEAGKGNFGPGLRLAVADRSGRGLWLYDVPIGRRCVLTSEKGGLVPVHVLRPNVDPPRTLHVFVEPSLEMLSMDLPRLANQSTELIFLSDRVKRALLP